MKNMIIDMENKNAGQLFSESLKKTGFAILVNHPIKKFEIDVTYFEWRKFFNSSDKFQYIRSRIDGEGYVPFEVENAKGFESPDLKEFYHYYPWGRQPKNIDTSSTMKLYHSLLNLGDTLLEWLDDNLPQKIFDQLSMPLKKMVKNSDRHLLRLLHYPPVEKKDSGMRSAPHTDINLLTILPASTASGLEILDNQGNWIKIPGKRDSIIVNAADMLNLCTMGYYKSATHRVVNPVNTEKNESRYAAPFFIHPRHNVNLKDGFTARDYWIQRLKEIGLYYEFLCINKNQLTLRE